MKKTVPSVNPVQNIPAVSKSAVQEAESEPTVAGIPVYPNPFRVLDHEIQLAGEVASAESNSDEEEVVPLLNPQRHKSECSVSLVDHK